jgi:hypothetical protein
MFGQMSSATSSLTVDVFRNLELVRFISRLDPLILSHGHTFRGLYRLAMNGVIPDSIRLRPDKAAVEPAVAEAAVGANAFDMLNDLSSLTGLEALGLVDPRPLRSDLDDWLRLMRMGERRHADPGDPSWSDKWRLLSVEAFVRRHGHRPAMAPEARRDVALQLTR